MGMAAGILSLRHPVVQKAAEVVVVVGGGEKPEGEGGGGEESKAAGGNSIASPQRAAHSKQLQMREFTTHAEVADVTTTTSTTSSPPLNDDEEEEEDAYMPWPTCVLGLPLPAFVTPRRLAKRGPPKTQAQWARYASFHSGGILFATLLVAVVDTLARWAMDWQHTISAQVWFQGLVAMTQLNDFVALTRDGGKSMASRFLLHPFCAWLGKISMNVYLIHYPMLSYLALIIHAQKASELRDCYGLNETAEPDRYMHCRQLIKEIKALPAWSVVVILPVAVVLGEGLYRYVEEPARKVLRAK
jgi:hypothetical protein